MIAPARIQFLKERIARYDDQQAYRELFQAFYNPLLQFSMGFIRSRQQAEEVVSDVFINIWEKRKRLEGITNLRVYLYSATRNITLNYISRQNRIHTTDIDELPIEHAAVYMDPERLLITAEMKRRINDAILKLPSRCRLIFKLVREDEFKYREVAEVLNISVKTVEAQMTIALKKISQAIVFDVRRTFKLNSRQ
jgi:RNA polymerase sigma-70 factor (ECF subfamily)